MPGCLWTGVEVLDCSCLCGLKSPRCWELDWLKTMYRLELGHLSLLENVLQISASIACGAFDDLDFARAFDDLDFAQKCI